MKRNYTSENVITQQKATPVPVKTVINKIEENQELNMSLEEDEALATKHLSIEELLAKRNKTKELEMQMKELENEKEKIENEIEKENMFNELYEYCKLPKSEFLLKITYSDGNFREVNVRNYLNAVVKGLGNSNTKIIKWKSLITKTLDSYVWFKTNQDITIRWITKNTENKTDLISFSMLQLKPDKFFEYF